MAKHRRKYSAEFKAQVVLEILSGVKSGAEVCREYGIRSQLLSKWKAQFLESAANVFEEQGQAPAEDKARIAELERLAGRQALVEWQAEHSPVKWLAGITDAWQLLQSPSVPVNLPLGA